jgi:glycerol kinase
MRDHNPAIKQIKVGGGLARFDGLCQRLADLGLPVVRHEQTETTTLGLAWLLTQDTLTPDRRLPLTGTPFLPHDNPGLQQRFQRWHETLNEALAND